MNRREFLTNQLVDTEISDFQGDISEFVEDQKPNLAINGALSREQAAHLLRRVNFGFTPSELDYYTGMDVSIAVDRLLGEGKEYLPENSNKLPDSSALGWLDNILENPARSIPELRGKLQSQLNTRYGQFLGWWYGLMIKEDTTKKECMEKLSLFWHTHWIIAYNYDGEDLIPPTLLYRNLDKIRRYRLGNYKKFVEEMSLDGAYLLFQSLNESTKKNPNENYMRELMELFTMGIGNYSEGDIREGSRVLTGWRVTAHLGDRKVFNNFDTYFDPDQHDITAKTIMGEPILARTIADNNIDKVREEEVLGLINILFKRRPEAIGSFMAKKFYLNYVYSSKGDVDNSHIKILADKFVSSNFELRPVFKELFTSDFFYEQKYFSAQIKSPIELYATLSKQLNFAYTGIYNALAESEQILYNAPDVSGWKGYHAWINTKTYPARVRHCREIIKLAKSENMYFFIDQIKNNTDLNQFLDTFLEVTLPKKVDNSRRARYLQVLTQTTQLSESTWKNAVDTKSELIANGLKALFNEVVAEPDYQLS